MAFGPGVVPVLAMARRSWRVEGPSGSGCFSRDGRARLDHRPFEPEQQLIVEQVRLVNAVVIDDQRLGHGTEVYQMMPITVVAGQSRGVQREDRPDFALEHQIEQAQEPASLDRTAAGAAFALHWVSS